MSLLRVAVPNKGSLAQSAAEILRESGYRQRDDAKQLTLSDSENGVEFFYLRPRDIALYVGEGAGHAPILSGPRSDGRASCRRTGH